MERWFDLQRYVTNWGTHRFMMRVPKRLVDEGALRKIFRDVDCVALRTTGGNVILDIQRDNIEAEDDWDDGSGWLAALAPLRADLLAGDLRACYLLWLTEVEAGGLAEDDREPMPGLGPITGALEALAALLDLDADLVEAASERPAEPPAPSARAVRKAVAAIPEDRKNELLVRVLDGDPLAARELRALVRDPSAPGPGAPRTVGDLQSRARTIRRAREARQAEQAGAERRRKAAEAEAADRTRRNGIARRGESVWGESVWGEIETQVERRNAAGYDCAASLLLDLRAIAGEQGSTEGFNARLRDIRDRHARKARFIKRIAALK